MTNPKILVLRVAPRQDQRRGQDESNEDEDEELDEDIEEESNEEEELGGSDAIPMDQTDDIRSHGTSLCKMWS